MQCRGELAHNVSHVLISVGSPAVALSGTVSHSTQLSIQSSRKSVVITGRVHLSQTDIDPDTMDTFLMTC